jgi:hypothetical protein
MDTLEDCESLKEFRKYIEALFAVREMTETLPYNVPEMLSQIEAKIKKEWKESQPIY